MIEYKIISNHGTVCFGIGDSTLCVPVRIPKIGYCPFEEDEVTIKVYGSIDEYGNDEGNEFDMAASVSCEKLILYADDSEVTKKIIETFSSSDGRFTMFVPKETFALALVCHE